MTPHLKSGETFTHGNNTFTAAEQLKFIIHLMGDLHQPLHCATNADAGGNCLRTAGFGTSELHAAWDGGMIRKVLLKTTTETALAQSLDQRFSGLLNTIVATTDLGDIAIESHSAAFQNAYGPMLANNLLPAPEPRPFLSLSPSECATKAADFFNIQPHPKLTQLYQMSTFDAVSQQLATGGYRLADLLNRAFQ
jgi:S1/P1 nuclease